MHQLWQLFDRYVVTHFSDTVHKNETRYSVNTSGVFSHDYTYIISQHNKDKTSEWVIRNTKATSITVIIIMMNMTTLSYSHCCLPMTIVMISGGVVLNCFKRGKKGGKYFHRTNFKLVPLMFWRLGSVVACTLIAHLDATWTACCLLVWSTGAWVTTDTTGASAG